MERKENKMGVMPVKRLIISMSLPMMVSMLVQALYNVVDSIFVARLSEQALTAVTLAFPLQNLMIAVSSGTGVGVNAILSKSLGEKRFDRSDKAANSAVLLAFCNFVLFFVIGFFFAGAFIRTQTANVEIAEMATTYLRIVTCVSAGIMYQMMFERLLQSTGKTVYSMISQMTGAIINIILDPIMIFGLLGMPAMGVAGAAIATCIGQIIAALLGFYFNHLITALFRSMFHTNFRLVVFVHEIQRNSGKMGGGAALQEKHFVVVRDVHDLAEQAFRLFDDVVEPFGTVGHLHDGLAAAVIVKQLGLRLFQRFQRKHRGTCGKIVNSAHCLFLQCI